MSIGVGPEWEGASGATRFFTNISGKSHDTKANLVSQTLGELGLRGARNLSM